MSSHASLMFKDGLQAFQMIPVQAEYQYPAVPLECSSRFSGGARRQIGRKHHLDAGPQLTPHAECAQQTDDVMGFEQSSSSHNEYLCGPFNVRNQSVRTAEHSRLLRSNKPISDARAAQLVARCLKVHKHQMNARVLRSFLNGHQSLDGYTLNRIVDLANDVLFDAKPNGRVSWTWSSESPYQEHLLGTTTLVRERHRPDKTMIVLSRPIIQSGHYGRNLLLSVLLHELVHCYLFLCCGSIARREGGHTDGFHKIMQIINDWAGMPELHLCNMKADLDQFRRKSDSEPVAYVESQRRNETQAYPSRPSKIYGAVGSATPFPKVVFYCGNSYKGCCREDCEDTYHGYCREDCGVSIPLIPLLTDGDSSGGESGIATPVEWEYKDAWRQDRGGKSNWVQSFNFR